jgi:hypothetical protein
MNDIEKCQLYRQFAKDGSLLYVGISNNALYRNGRHSSRPWAKLVSKIEITDYPSRDAALEAETLAIQTENPRCNNLGFTTPPPMAPAQFRKAISELRLSQEESGEFFGYSPRTGQRWANDETPVPVSVAIAIKLMLEYGIKPDDINDMFSS